MTTLTDFRPNVADVGSATTNTTEHPGHLRVGQEQPSGVPTPRWLNYVAMRLNDMTRRTEPLEGLPVASPEALGRALGVALTYFPDDAPPPSVRTTFDGGVEFSWNQDGWDVEIEVSETESTFWLQDSETGITWEGSLDDWVRQAAAVLASFSH